ncbi:MAG: DegV family protein [Ruminococcaceae bacterium]|nr:DegV family protein [Oscillospiraceae bacterium]
MNNYIIFTDSACDIPAATLKEWGVEHRSLTFRFDGSEKEYFDGEIPSKDFYDKMRAGGIAKTAAINVDTFAAEFEKILKDGTDVLYIGFSSGLSTTFNSGRLAAEQLREKYPERKIIAVDSLAASAGFGLIIHLVLEKKAAGATIEEAAAYVEEIRNKLCHWFTVDDLVYLKRGGRVSAAAAFFGNALGIKPVLHVDNEGHLVPVTKVRGRKTAIKALADKFDELAVDHKGGTIYISHGDCLDEVNMLVNIIKEKHGVDVELITNVGTVIGAHSGPGTIALFFIGTEK